MVLFVGIQGSGKSSFYKERFYATHVRINRDMLKTAHRERAFIDTCLATQQRLVIDNTNPTRAERARYIQLARNAGFRAVGYYFRTNVRDAIGRNARRIGKARIPVPGILWTYKRLEVPALSEGFNELFCVTLAGRNRFTVEKADEQNLIK